MKIVIIIVILTRRVLFVMRHRGKQEKERKRNETEMDGMKALELNELLTRIEACLMARQCRTLDYLYIHIMGKIRLDESPHLSPNDAAVLKMLTKDPSRNTDVDEVCREALRGNVYPVLSDEQLQLAENIIIDLSGKCYPATYPMKEKLQRAREAGYL